MRAGNIMVIASWVMHPYLQTYQAADTDYVYPMHAKTLQSMLNS
jgi:hypothetical protein